MTRKSLLLTVAAIVVVYAAFHLREDAGISCSDPEVLKTLHQVLFPDDQFAPGMKPNVALTNVRTIDSGFPPNGATCAATGAYFTRENEPTSLSIEVHYMVQGTDDKKGFVVTTHR